MSHRAYAKVRQDAYGVRVTGDGRYLIVAVADGLSSGALSHVAAEAAVNRGIRRLGAVLAGAQRAFVDWTAFFRVLSSDVEQDCRADLLDRGVVDAGARPLADVAATMATTASFAVLDLVPAEDGHRMVTGTIGDTSVWVLGADGGWLPTQPVKNDGAELHSSATRALPLPAEPVLSSGSVRPGEALVVMTDGVGDPLGHGTGEVGTTLARLWRTPPHELDFAAQVGFARKTYDDDRTVVALWPARP
ncbi:serine/threonine protein phosphatase PrpC [Actinokineospora baliensis]|uniref:protein phosphatase 2C domain-containing protein n=1 Tax=Actinokineospora baliensis TaxID=547056 RepID=UPI00195C24DA|nr:protein phosphatase 2C domain-containing protein [Actinokineospora baliensis]MBM7769885.1 serine/threonine protein phosphatase PrpC [Actinokineospora baliensis]